MKVRIVSVAVVGSAGTITVIGAGDDGLVYARSISSAGELGEWICLGAPESR